MRLPVDERLCDAWRRIKESPLQLLRNHPPPRSLRNPSHVPNNYILFPP
jgi:hypothetical protein